MSIRETLLTSSKHNHGKSQFLQDFYLLNLRSDLQQRKKLGLPFLLHPAATTPKSVLPAQRQASWLLPSFARCAGPVARGLPLPQGHPTALQAAGTCTPHLQPWACPARIKQVKNAS